MVTLATLWLPVLLSAAAVFLVSALIHMATPWHKGDFRRVPREAEAMAALRPFELTPGDYLMPRPAQAQDMRSAEFKALHRQGPVLLFTVLPSGQMGIGAQLLGWFIYTVVISLLAGFVAATVLPPGSRYLLVFHTVGLCAFLGYSGALAQQSIWFRRDWGTTVRSILDGLLFALLSAGIFGWLWPR